MRTNNHAIFKLASIVLLNYREGDYIGGLTKRTRVTYSFCVKLIKKLHKEGIIDIKVPKRNKRTKELILTTKGKEIQGRLLAINEAFEGGEYHVKLNGG